MGKEATRDRVVVEGGSGVPYAAIHNAGGIIKVTTTPKAQKFFWYMFKKTGDSKWKAMALTKKTELQIKTPQR